jgi:hypothetical protein
MTLQVSIVHLIDILLDNGTGVEVDVEEETKQEFQMTIVIYYNPLNNF